MTNDYTKQKMNIKNELEEILLKLLDSMQKPEGIEITFPGYAIREYYDAMNKLIQKRDWEMNKRFAVEMASVKSNHMQEKTVWKAEIIQELKKKKKRKLCCDECDSMDDKNTALDEAIEVIKKS